MESDERPGFASGMQAVGTGLTRRDLLTATAISCLGSASDWLLGPDANATESGGRSAPREAAVILLWMEGGPSHLDTFDPKPEAEAGIRGPFRAIRTSVDGVLLCEHLPGLAREMHRMAILRGVSHGDGVHERARHRLLTGHALRASADLPDYGALLVRERSAATRFTSQSTPHRMRHGVTARFSEDALSRGARTAGSLAESERAGYGRSRFGQGCLLARQLIESGARFVTVGMDGWDTHENNFPRLRDELLPSLDAGMSALLRDLARRGMLETTLVVWMGEFGRTPIINGNARPGRDHWPWAMSVVMAGGGVRGGTVVGSTDQNGTRPIGRPIRVEEVAATIYFAAGADPDAEFVTPDGDTVRLANGGSPIRELF